MVSSTNRQVKKSPSDQIIQKKIDETIKDLERIKALVPLVRMHRLRNVGPKPISIETKPFVIRSYEPDPEPLDKRALLTLLDALDKWTSVRHLFSNRLPALDAQMSGKRVTTAVKAESSGCVVCGDESQLRRGMCVKHYNAFRRDGFPEAGPWIVEQRKAADGN